MCFVSVSFFHSFTTCTFQRRKKLFSQQRRTRMEMCSVRSLGCVWGLGKHRLLDFFEEIQKKLSFEVIILVKCFSCHQNFCQACDTSQNHPPTCFSLFPGKTIIHYHRFSRWSVKALHLYKQIFVVSLIHTFECTNNAGEA